MSLVRSLLAAALLTGATAPLAAQAPDPRVGLAAGWKTAGVAARHVRLVGHADKPDGMVNAEDPGDFGFLATDLAFQGTRVFQGSYFGWQVWDVRDPAAPTLLHVHRCPGGQGDVSVFGTLLFVSVEEPRGRLDCGTQGVADTVSAERFMGVRIFDITDVTRPKQLAAVQTCRGSHTHTLVPDPRDRRTLYVYVSGTNDVRRAAELAGCADGDPDRDSTTSRFRIEVIKVPLDAPQAARVVAEPRLFADRATGRVAGLWRGGGHGEGTQATAETDQCHDITVYPAIGLAAGACSGNGILLDISRPAAPVRIDEVVDPNFAYWHSATFANDGRAVLFTDEWGGGVAPHCRASDRPEWGADAIFRLEGRKLSHAGYFKIPAPQTATENCVAHNGSLVPVPGRDILVQAWYQGGLSVVDFTDRARPREIAFFDRGPMDASRLQIAGYWSAYWHNGRIYGSEIGRGLDILELEPSEHLSANELAAARLVRRETFNPQWQQPNRWPAAFVVSRAYVDQLERDGGLPAARVGAIRTALDAAERARGATRRVALTRLAAALDRDAAGARDAAKVRLLAGSVRALAGGR